MQIRSKIMALAAGAALAVTMAACGGGEAGGTAGDTLTIGIKYDQPGLGQKDGETFKGLDVDVARYVAKELGFADDKVILKETPSAQRETAIQGGQVALIFATYSITDARKEKVSFAGPYFIAGQDLHVFGLPHIKRTGERGKDVDVERRLPHRRGTQQRLQPLAPGAIHRSLADRCVRSSAEVTRHLHRQHAARRK